MTANTHNPPDPEARTLRDQGIAALQTGDKHRARDLLIAAATQDLQDVQTWLWLSGAVATPAEQRYCLERVQAIDPEHAAAGRGLSLLANVAAVSPLPPPPPEERAPVALPSDPLPSLMTATTATTAATSTLPQPVLGRTR